MSGEVRTNRVGPRCGFDKFCARPLNRTTPREREELYRIWYFKKYGVILKLPKKEKLKPYWERW